MRIFSAVTSVISSPNLKPRLLNETQRNIQALEVQRPMKISLVTSYTTHHSALRKGEGFNGSGNWVVVVMVTGSKYKDPVLTLVLQVWMYPSRCFHGFSWLAVSYCACLQGWPDHLMPVFLARHWWLENHEFVSL